jgi:Rha family phage regulatory protein
VLIIFKGTLMSIITKSGLKLVMEKGKVFCDSRELAKQFGKLHKNVIAKIEEEIKQMESLKLSPPKIKEFFIESHYVAGKNKRKYKKYLLTFKGFQQIALQFTGKEALINRFKFIEFFEELIRQIEKDKLKAIQNKMSQEWISYRIATKKARRELTDAIKEHIIDYRANIEKKYNDGRYYQHYTKLIYKKLNIVLPKGANPRDVLDEKTLARLTALEYDIADRIDELAQKGLHYKEVFKQIKKELL